MHFLPHRRARPLRLFLLASLAFGLAPVRAAAPDARKPAPAMFTHDELRRQFAYSVVAASGPDSPRNDSASVAELADRTLFLVWHKYRMNPVAGSDFGQADIAAKISCDGGATWKGERRLIEFAPGDLNIQAPAICALPNGELLLAALRAHAQNSSSMCLFRSGDQGLTWREAGKVWDHSRGQWLQGGTPSIVRLRSGRLVLPFHGGTGDQGRQHNTAGCFVSDDDGRSWRRTPAVIDLPMRGAMEASVAELASGRLLMSLRTQLGGVFLCESNDRAETWSLPWNAGVTAPESSSCLRRVGDSSALILLWNGCEFYEPKHHHYGQRSPLTLAWSGDDGRTWRRIGDLENDPESEFTNLNCLFTRGGDAVITYGVWSPAFNRKNPRRADQCAIVIPRTFWKQLR